MSQPTESNLPGSGASAPTPVAQPAQPQIDMSSAAICYANFCRVTGTPEELIFDFGLRIQTSEALPEHIVTTHEVATSFYTAKRLMYALQMTIQRHEAAFGVLEVDVNKRILPAARTS